MCLVVGGGVGSSLCVFFFWIRTPISISYVFSSFHILLLTQNAYPVVPPFGLLLWLSSLPWLGLYSTDTLSYCGIIFGCGLCLSRKMIKTLIMHNNNTIPRHIGVESTHWVPSKCALVLYHCCVQRVQGSLPVSVMLRCQRVGASLTETCKRDCRCMNDHFLTW